MIIEPSSCAAAAAAAILIDLTLEAKYLAGSDPVSHMRASSDDRLRYHAVFSADFFSCHPLRALFVAAPSFTRTKRMRAFALNRALNVRLQVEEEPPKKLAR
jgi:hypothetical protein